MYIIYTLQVSFLYWWIK